MASWIVSKPDANTFKYDMTEGHVERSHGSKMAILNFVQADCAGLATSSASTSKSAMVASTVC